MIHPDDIRLTGPRNPDLSEALRDLHEWAGVERVIQPAAADLWATVQEWAQGTACKYGCGMRRKPASKSRPSKS